MPKAGWYPDPEGGEDRRYWTGRQWAEHWAGPELPEPKRMNLWFPSVIAGMGLTWVIVQATQNDLAATYGALLFVIGVAAASSWGLWALQQRKVNEKRRQQSDDHRRALAINAETEHRAFMQGDDELGLFGQYPPPPLPGDAELDSR